MAFRGYQIVALPAAAQVVVAGGIKGDHGWLQIKSLKCPHQSNSRPRHHTAQLPSELQQEKPPAEATLKSIHAICLPPITASGTQDWHLTDSALLLLAPQVSCDCSC